MQIPNQLKTGDRIQLSGSRKMHRPWLHGKNSINATILEFKRGNKEDTAIVKLDHPLRAFVLPCRYATLNLRTQDKWEPKGVVHVTLHKLNPKTKTGALMGRWVEGAASYKKISNDSIICL